MWRRLSWVAALVAAVLLLAVVANVAWLLGGNPGYFSHDELQWAVYAELERSSSSANWLNIAQFQYRPLTFHLWMLLSRVLFESPRLYHVVWLLLGALNAGLLFAVLRRIGVQLRVAAVSAALFWLSPYAVFVHGWIGTLGDLIWVMAGLLTALLVLSAGKGGLSWSRLVAVALLTAAALLAKEAALSIPSLLFAGWLFTREGAWRSAFLASAAVAAVYLLLRFGVLTDASTDRGGYGIDLGGALQRFAYFQIFPFFPWAEEIHVMSIYSYERLRNMAILTFLIWLFALRGPRDWLAWWLLSSAALGPALLIGSISNQYGYGLAAVLVGLAAWRWQDAGVLRRGVLMFGAAIMCWHALGVARHMREVGELQAVYSQSMAAAVRQARPSEQKPLGLRPDCDYQRWIYGRLSNSIPRYDGVPIGSRVLVLSPSDTSLPGEQRIDCNGRVYSVD